MLRRFVTSGLLSVVSAVIVVAFSTPAMADATATARALAEQFSKAFSACDQPGIESLYEDSAVAIFPGLGEEAKGKAAIGKMAVGVCKTPVGKQVSSVATNVGADYIVNIGRWESGVQGPDGKPMTVVIRTTELLHKGADGKWRYVVDHASIGLPPPPPAPKVASR